MWNVATHELVDQSLRAGNVVSFTVPTTSMLPFLAPGDQVVVRSAKLSELRIGDILVWEANGMGDAQSTWIVHRLIERRVRDGGLEFITQGDNSGFADKPISEDQITGIVTCVQRRNSEKVTDTLSCRARKLGVILALLSNLQSFVQNRFDGTFQRIVAKAMRVIKYGFGKLARKMAG